jgi:hypothetical protein
MKELDYTQLSFLEINPPLLLILNTLLRCNGYVRQIVRHCQTIYYFWLIRWSFLSASFVASSINTNVDTGKERMIFLDLNALFESLLRQLREYSELKDILYSILFRGVSVGFNQDNPVNDIATMFGFVKNVDGRVAIANRIFETRLYNYFISEEDANNRIHHAGEKYRNQFVLDGVLDMDLIMERFAVEFNNLYHGANDKFIEDNGRKFFLLFLKPIINGTGNYYIEARTRDNQRTDLIVNYHGIEYIVECKIWHGEEHNKRGEKQLANYLDIYGAKKGWLLSFNFNSI